MKDYRHLIAPDDHYDPSDEHYRIIEPPTLDLISQFWHAAGTSSSAFEAFITGPPSITFEKFRLVYCIDHRGQNFLHMAAAVGDPRTIELLCRLFADRHGKVPRHVRDIQEQVPRQRDVDGNMPLHIAAANDHLEFVKALLQYHTFGDLDDFLETSSPYIEKEHYATRWDVRFILPLLDFKNEAGRTAEREAWRCGATRTARWLHTLRSNYVAAYTPYEEEEEEEEKEEDVPLSLSAQRPIGSQVLQIISACGAMMLAMFVFDLWGRCRETGRVTVARSDAI